MSEVNLNSKSVDSLQILLVRPGATELDEQGRIRGSLSIPLSETGETQARETAERLFDYRVQVIYSSPCLAAQQTAQQLSHDGKIKIKVEQNLMNLDHGLWHGKLIEELKETQPKMFKQWQEHPERVCPPNGETIEQVRNRVTTLLKKVRRKHKKGIVLFVVPEPILSVIRSELERIELDDLWQIDSRCGDWLAVNLAADALA